MLDMGEVTFYESVALELYSGEELLATANLKVEEIKAGYYPELTGSITINDVDPSDTWPVDKCEHYCHKVPAKVVLVIDGAEADSVEVIYNGNPDQNNGEEISQEVWGAVEGVAHTDEDFDHACDYGCDVTMGDHKDSADDEDHICDYCKSEEVLEECTPVTDAAKAPTCTETGLTEGSHCSVCEKVLVAQETVPDLEHKWDECFVA